MNYGLGLLIAVPALFVAPSHGATAILVRDNGNPANRISLVYVAEGYTTPELPRFATTVEKASRYRDTAAMAEPYKRYQHFFNAYRVELPSVESGITHPGEAQKNTPLGGQADNDRLGTVDDRKLGEAVKTAMTGLGAKRTWHFAVLNDPKYFNSGGGNACVFSENYWGEIALHEGGHAFHALADEYGGTGTGSGSEPREINVTADMTGKKWSLWNGYKQPFVGENKPFEGGRYFDKGIFRPSNNSKMNITSQERPAAFNMVSVEKIIQDIYAVVTPLDAFRDNKTTLTDPDSLWVKPVDLKVIWVDWSMDGKVIKQNQGSSLLLSEIPGLTLGAHKIKAHAYDEVVMHTGTDNANPHPLDWVRQGLDKLQQDVEWNIILTKPVAVAQNKGTNAQPNSWTDAGLSFNLASAGKYRINLFTPDGRNAITLKGVGKSGLNVLPNVTGKIPNGSRLIFQVSQ